jgi:SAM-dependent methyltransferase
VSSYLSSRRLLPRGRWLAKQGLVRWDLFRHRNSEDFQRWANVLSGARTGHVVVPSRAIATSRSQAADFVDHNLVKPGDRVLDVGAGNGRQAIGLLEIGVASYTGLEVVKGSADYANGAFKGRGNVRFDWLDVANKMYNPTGSQLPHEVVFPYDDESFEFVVASSLYTHLEEVQVIERYVQETARVLRTEGGAFMSFFRSPPNQASDSAIRTVIPEAEIKKLVEDVFVIEEALGGDTTGFHDQWRLYLRKRSSEPDPSF